jgi:hypothetical protein
MGDFPQDLQPSSDSESSSDWARRGAEIEEQGFDGELKLSCH